MGRTEKPGILGRLGRWIGKLFFRLFLLFIVLSILEVLFFRFVNPPTTAFWAWQWMKAAVLSRPFTPVRHEWRDLERISPHLRKAVLAGEDQRFLDHHGFDFVELEYALRDAVKDGKVRGASTITMQTARVVFLWPDRTVFRKAFEAYYTVLLELFWSKERILETYLNMVDWGPGVMGAEAACRKYFDVGADRVTPLQAAGLAAILPSPHRWSPVRPGKYVSARRKRINEDMKTMPDVN